MTSHYCANGWVWRPYERVLCSMCRPGMYVAPAPLDYAAWRTAHLPTLLRMVADIDAYARSKKGVYRH